MNRDYKFRIDQKVKMRDDDTEEMVRGIVTDYTSNSVFIKWEDLTFPIEHFQNEYEKIKCDLK